MVDLIDQAEWLGFPSVALGELWMGFLQGGRIAKNQRELEDFLNHPLVEELRVDRDVARIYGEICVDLRKAGTPIPVNDIWIAAAAARVGVPVLTYDDHFLSIRRVDSVYLQPPNGS